MLSKSIKNKKIENITSKILGSKNYCKISKASTEIMLDRFCNGNEIDFPFSK